jgi:hypothetical protein
MSQSDVCDVDGLTLRRVTQVVAEASMVVVRQG